MHPIEHLLYFSVLRVQLRRCDHPPRPLVRHLPQRAGEQGGQGFVGGKLKEPAWVLATTLMGGALVGVAPLIKLGLTCAAAF